MPVPTPARSTEMTNEGQGIWRCWWFGIVALSVCWPVFGSRALLSLPYAKCGAVLAIVLQRLHTNELVLAHRKRCCECTGTAQGRVVDGCPDRSNLKSLPKQTVTKCGRMNSAFISAVHPRKTDQNSCLIACSTPRGQCGLHCRTQRAAASAELNLLCLRKFNPLQFTAFAMKATIKSPNPVRCRAPIPPMDGTWRFA